MDKKLNNWVKIALAYVTSLTLVGEGHVLSVVGEV